jgi:hypothetical protein
MNEDESVISCTFMKTPPAKCQNGHEKDAVARSCSSHILFHPDVKVIKLHEFVLELEVTVVGSNLLAFVRVRIHQSSHRKGGRINLTDDTSAVCKVASDSAPSFLLHGIVVTNNMFRPLHLLN